jgi:peroxiredoxin
MTKLMMLLLAVWWWATLAPPVKDFTLPSVSGKQVGLKDYPNAKGFILIFTCNHCPFAKLYPDRINALHDQFAPLGVPVLAISSTDTVAYEEDGFPQMQQRATEGNYRFPYLYDRYQTVAKDFNANKTPHAFVIWRTGDQYTIRYSGAIDDNGAHPDEVKNAYIKDAVEALLNGQKVKITQTASIGCKIYFRN